MAHRYSLTLPLPPGYRPADILAFHRRDPQQLAEQVGESCLKKGIVWQGVPACLSVQFSPEQAEAHLDLDGEPKDDEAQGFAIWTWTASQRMTKRRASPPWSGGYSDSPRRCKPSNNATGNIPNWAS